MVGGVLYPETGGDAGPSTPVPWRAERKFLILTQKTSDQGGKPPRERKSWRPYLPGRKKGLTECRERGPVLLTERRRKPFPTVKKGGRHGSDKVKKKEKTSACFRIEKKERTFTAKKGAERREEKRKYFPPFITERQGKDPSIPTPFKGRQPKDDALIEEEGKGGREGKTHLLFGKKKKKGKGPSISFMRKGLWGWKKRNPSANKEGGEKGEGPITAIIRKKGHC